MFFNRPRRILGNIIAITRFVCLDTPDIDFCRIFVGKVTRMMFVFSSRVGYRQCVFPYYEYRFSSRNYHYYYTLVTAPDSRHLTGSSVSRGYVCQAPKPNVLEILLKKKKSIFQSHRFTTSLSREVLDASECHNRLWTFIFLVYTHYGFSS